jgi:hypothetical protein
MSKLKIAAGKTRNVDKTLNLSRSRTNPPIITRPRIIPSMKPNDPIIPTQGNNPTQTTRKAGDSSAIALNMISIPAMKYNAAGTQRDIVWKGKNGIGPTSMGAGVGMWGPNGATAAPACMGACL